MFCICLNKTGTTTLKYALERHEYIVGKEKDAIKYLEDYSKRDFSGLIEYCKLAEAFQDTPFSWWYTFIIMDQVFPNSYSQNVVIQANGMNLFLGFIRKNLGRTVRLQLQTT